MSLPLASRDAALLLLLVALLEFECRERRLGRRQTVRHLPARVGRRHQPLAEREVERELGGAAAVDGARSRVPDEREQLLGVHLAAHRREGVARGDERRQLGARRRPRAAPPNAAARRRRARAPPPPPPARRTPPHRGAPPRARRGEQLLLGGERAPEQREQRVVQRAEDEHLGVVARGAVAAVGSTAREQPFDAQGGAELGGEPPGARERRPGLRPRRRRARGRRGPDARDEGVAPRRDRRRRRVRARRAEVAPRRGPSGRRAVAVATATQRAAEQRVTPRDQRMQPVQRDGGPPARGGGGRGVVGARSSSAARLDARGARPP